MSRARPVRTDIGEAAMMAMPPAQRAHWLAAELKRTQARESRRAVAASAFDDMVRDMLDDLREVAAGKGLGAVAERRTRELIAKYAVAAKAVRDGRGYRAKARYEKE